MSEQWQEKYKDLLFGENWSDKTRAETVRIKFCNMPPKLYKYRFFCENHKEALYNGILYASPVDSFNDIKEANIVLTKNAEKSLYQKTYNEFRREYGWPEARVTSALEFVNTINCLFKSMSKSFDDIDFMQTPQAQEMVKLFDSKTRAYLKEIRKNARSMYNVCSFSAVNNSCRMWGLYADSSKGFCIEYDFKSGGIDCQETAFLFPVLYTDNCRVFVDDIDKIDGNIGMLAATLKEKKDWATEYEWRVLCLGNSKSVPLKMPKPTAIYLGEKAEKDDIVWMIDFCKSNHIPLYQMAYNEIKDCFVSSSLCRAE